MSKKSKSENDSDSSQSYDFELTTPVSKIKHEDTIDDIINNDKRLKKVKQIKKDKSESCGMGPFGMEPLEERKKQERKKQEEWLKQERKKQQKINYDHDQKSKIEATLSIGARALIFEKYTDESMFTFWCEFGNTYNLFEKYGMDSKYPIHQRKSYLKDEEKLALLRDEIKKENENLTYIKKQLFKAGLLKEKHGQDPFNEEFRKAKAERDEKDEIEERMRKIKREEEERQKKLILVPVSNVYDEEKFLESLNEICWEPNDTTNENMELVLYNNNLNDLNYLDECFKKNIVNENLVNKYSLLNCFQNGEILFYMKKVIKLNTQLVDHINKMGIKYKLSTVNNKIKFYKLVKNYPILMHSKWNYTKIKKNFSQIEKTLKNQPVKSQTNLPSIHQSHDSDSSN